MNFHFLAPAGQELEEVIAYYNSQSEGLGFEFAAEVKRTMERIGQYPDAWQLLSQLGSSGGPSGGFLDAFALNRISRLNSRHYYGL